MLLSFFQARDLHRSGKHPRDREFLRSMSMFPHENYDDILRAAQGRYPRSFSGTANIHHNRDEFLAQQFSSRDALMRTFEQLHPYSNDDEAEEDADDEDDDYRTPTVMPRSPPKFPTNN